MRTFFVRCAAAAVFAAVATGCYGYAPAGAVPVPRGTPVRLRLERPCSFQLPSMTAHHIERLTAEMVREDGNTLVLSALRLASADGEDFDGRQATIDVSRADIAALEVRKVSVWRTAVLMAGALVGTWLGFEALGGGSAGAEGPGGGGETH